jgi:hypothetical protein
MCVEVDLDFEIVDVHTINQYSMIVASSSTLAPWDSAQQSSVKKGIPQPLPSYATFATTQHQSVIKMAADAITTDSKHAMY